jgi:hypothetical protein
LNSAVARRIPYFLLVTLAFVLALVPVRPSPDASVQDHNFWLLKWWLPSIVPLSIAIIKEVAWPRTGSHHEAEWFRAELKKDLPV